MTTEKRDESRTVSKDSPSERRRAKTADLLRRMDDALDEYESEKAA